MRGMASTLMNSILRTFIAPFPEGAAILGVAGRQPRRMARWVVIESGDGRRRGVRDGVLSLKSPDGAVKGAGGIGSQETGQ